MRQIKFRAWDEKNKKISIVEKINFLTGEIDTELCLDNENELIIMQFTGLLDKNGKEIYEGDIVRAQGQFNQYLQVVEFHNSAETSGRGWVGVNKIIEANPITKSPRENIERFSYFSWPSHWEIIGNIHENPELLKQQE